MNVKATNRIKCHMKSNKKDMVFHKDKNRISYSALFKPTILANK